MTAATPSGQNTMDEAAPIAPRPVVKTNDHNAAVDTLRGLAAAMVVVFHMEFWGFFIVPGEVAFLGALGVNLFFTLSGFLIARAVLVPPAFDRLKYLRNRSLRILPNYFICCFLTLFIVNGNTISHATPGGLLFDLGMHAVLMHGWFASIANSITGPLWTLSHEWIFYLLIGCTAPLLRSRRGWVLPLAMCAIAIAGKYLVMGKIWTPSTHRLNPLCHWDQFGLGIIGALFSLASTGWKRRKLWTWLAAIAGVIVVGGCFYRQYATAVEFAAANFAEGYGSRTKGLGNNYAAEFYRKRSNVIWFPFVFSAGVSMVLIAVTGGFQRLNLWLAKTPLPWMGKVSYSTYLYHMAVLLCLARGFSSAKPGELFSSRGVASVVALIGIYAVSAFFFHFFEKPWLERKSALRQVK